MSDTCETKVEFFGVVLDCKNAATRRFEVGCVHGHVRTLATCDNCAPGHEIGADLCRRCAEGSEPHDCPITFSELPVAAPLAGVSGTTPEDPNER